jgi:TPR repeat protein
MKTLFVAACAILFAVAPFTSLLANETQKSRGEADEYFQQGNFSKAFKEYRKLAKSGDHYSQDQLAQMYAKGQGKKADLSEAYAWSVLAAEGGNKEFVANSEALLQRTPDKAKALKSAEKLQKKYGKQALATRAEKKGRFIPGSDCTGTKLGCRTH